MKPIYFLVLALFVLFACEKDKDDDNIAIKDIEGNVYHAVKIGTQVWMVENLRTSKYNDGADIPLVTDINEWINLDAPGYCWYNNEISNKTPYGALYNWYAVNTGKLCPEGWHVPTKDEWLALFAYLGDEDEEDVGKLKEEGFTHWESPNTGATNETGLTLVPGGERNRDGIFQLKGKEAIYYSSTEGNITDGIGYVFFYDKISFGTIVDYKTRGFSVRCIKD
jgi:uncharacterized protein (TIGR02145 family)